MHASLKQAARVILSVIILSISLVAIIALFNGIDVGEMVREHRKAELAEQTEQLELYEQTTMAKLEKQSTEEMLLSLKKYCAKYGIQCEPQADTNSTRRATTLSPWVELKDDTSNFTFGWAEEATVGTAGKRTQFSGPALQYYSSIGQDVPINRPPISK
jgi:hypothetical protein